MRKLWKIHIGMIVGIFISFISIVIVSLASEKEMNVYFPIAILLTYEFLIINFLKDDFLTKEYKEKAKLEFSEKQYPSFLIYRIIIKIFLAICILLTPIMWAMAILN